MMKQHTYIRHSLGAVRPYLYGHPDLLDFVKTVFEAEEVERVPSRSGAHIELRIGDGVVVLEIGESFPDATRSSVYIYVPNVDAAYERALQAGATSLEEPSDKPYHERGAGVKDAFGNTWWMATCTG